MQEIGFHCDVLDASFDFTLYICMYLVFFEWIRVLVVHLNVTSAIHIVLHNHGALFCSKYSILVVVISVLEEGWCQY